MNRDQHQHRAVLIIIAIALFLAYGIFIVYVSAVYRKVAETETQTFETNLYLGPHTIESPQALENDTLAREQKLKQVLKQSLRQTVQDTKYQEKVLEQKRDERKSEVSLEEFKKDQDDFLLERELGISR